MYNASEAGLLSVLSTAFYAIIIYGNASWLIPTFYSRKRYWLYGIFLVFFLSLVITLRFFAWLLIYNHSSWHQKASANLQTFVFTSFTGIFTFFFSILYRIAIDYFKLTTHQAALKADKIQTELNMLKQQVQPHFLFNTLNNIYYVTQQNSPEAADLISRLAEIIRYFMEESKKESVLLKDEIELLKSYIELEGIRMRYNMPVDFSVKGEIGELKIPPLLLLPMTENIYKHGIDKRSESNFAELRLEIDRDSLTFTTLNRAYPVNPAKKTSRSGLDNLGKRLQLIYGNEFTLKTLINGDVFIVFMELPLINK